MIYTHAISPYDDWHRQAWAAGLVLLVLVLVANIACRWVLSHGDCHAKRISLCMGAMPESVKISDTNDAYADAAARRTGNRISEDQAEGDEPEFLLRRLSGPA